MVTHSAAAAARSREGSRCCPNVSVLSTAATSRIEPRVSARATTTPGSCPTGTAGRSSYSALSVVAKRRRRPVPPRPGGSSAHIGADRFCSSATDAGTRRSSARSHGPIRQSGHAQRGMGIRCALRVGYSCRVDARAAGPRLPRCAPAPSHSLASAHRVAGGQHRIVATRPPAATRDHRGSTRNDATGSTPATAGSVSSVASPSTGRCGTTTTGQRRSITSYRGRQRSFPTTQTRTSDSLTGGATGRDPTAHTSMTSSS